MPAITLTISGDTPTGVSLITFTDAATGTDVHATAGLTLPAAFTDAGGGEWTRAFTDTGAARYAYTYRLTWSDGSTDDEAGSQDGASDHYGSRAGMIALLGPNNETTFADINSDGVSATIAAMEEAALSEGDAKVNAYLLGEDFTVPASTDAAKYSMVVYAANRYSAVALSRMRGLPVTQSGQVVDQYAKYLDEADAMLMRLASSVYGALTTGPTGPSADSTVTNRALYAGGYGYWQRGW